MTRRVLALPFLAAAMLAATPLHAGSVVLWPIDPVIASGEKATALWIENRGPAPVTLQIRSFAWNQSNGDDHFDRQDEVIPSPPIAHVAPGQRQLVRIIRRTTGAAPAEHCYRLLVDELPPPIDASRADAVSAHLAVQMRYSIPLFAYDGTGARGTPSLAARTVLVDGKPYAEIRNTGDIHARLVDLRVVRGGRTVTAAAGLIGYVLAGSTMRWPLPADAPLDGALVVNVNGTDTSLTPTA
ncbi:fimbrial biogenesis chaperone [Sphingomonas sp. PR090111-T3T-6A]|uniref:fimbrial biogenesis chaperone n=1 Tax=Sphingomonas sp. PR090111-T3T-6A TaxID=685778 RepID=UPI00037F0328|nr:molecular chaperone [Sphingomonas sp. PR090111-T3T-6A]